MNEELLKAIHAELVQIRQLLEAKPVAAPTRAAPARNPSTPSAFTASGEEAPVPQPTEIVPNAGEVQVHFGKNNGVPLAKLSERSLSWYAQEQAPRLDSSGNPYPVRPQETLLRNAARTLWHQNRGTLNVTPAAKTAGGLDELASAESSSHLADQENSPF